MDYIIVVTDNDAGWDCVEGAYVDIATLKKRFKISEDIPNLNTLTSVCDYLNNKMKRGFSIHQVKLQK